MSEVSILGSSLVRFLLMGRGILEGWVLEYRTMESSAVSVEISAPTTIASNPAWKRSPGAFSLQLA